ncbi:hypothetical protein ACFVUS_09180 [Nocardia sp. NPDC058058]|uniref:hypothetical protein n=1 Tax=Nocardia sp. NPDC058058 TaxID=3346317 RepID=UPI0036D77D58
MELTDSDPHRDEFCETSIFHKSRELSSRLRRTSATMKSEDIVEFLGSIAGLAQMVIGTILANTGSGGSGSGW